MVQVSVTASVKVAGGPTITVGTALNPTSYTFAATTLDAGAEEELALLPDGGTVTLLALTARAGGGASAAVAVVPSNGTDDGAEIVVPGTLLVANPGVLAALVDGGPRSLTVRNDGAAAVTVEVLTGLDPTGDPAPPEPPG